MSQLSPAFIKNLATKAHQLNPVVLIGAKGLTPTVHNEIDTALLAHELIKIRVNAASRENRQCMIQDIVAAHQGILVQQIGHVLVLYRANPHKK